MFRKIDDRKRTASVNGNGLVTMMYDEGWENLLDCRMTFDTQAKAVCHLLNTGWEEFDPNAELKAKGLKWNGYCYA